MAFCALTRIFFRLNGVRLENGNYPTLKLYFVQPWRRMRDQQFINRDSFLLKRLNGSFYIKPYSRVLSPPYVVSARWRGNSDPPASRSLISRSRCIKDARPRALRTSPLFSPACMHRPKPLSQNQSSINSVRSLQKIALSATSLNAFTLFIGNIRSTR